MISDFLGLNSRAEVILIITTAIIALSLDDSSSQIGSDLGELWSFNFGDEIRKRNAETVLKSVLEIVLLIRSYTAKIFFGLYVLLLWPIIAGKKYYLMLPWLAVGFVRSVLVTLLTSTTGTYVCLVQKGYSAICLEFILAQAIEHGPSIYAWFSIYRHYQFLSRNNKNMTTTNHQPQLERGRSSTADSTIMNLIINLRKLRPFDIPTRSLDSLLSLPHSRLRDKDPGKSISDFVKKTLSIADEDIDKARREKSCRTFPEPGFDIVLAKNVSFSSRRKFDRQRHDNRVKHNEDFVTKEVELKCVSLDDSVHSGTAQGLDDCKKNCPQDNERTSVSSGGEENNFSCQVSTLSRSIFNESPTEVTERFSLVKNSV